jgi:hypothetical protein
MSDAREFTAFPGGFNTAGDAEKAFHGHLGESTFFWPALTRAQRNEGSNPGGCIFKPLKPSSSLLAFDRHGLA